MEPIQETAVPIMPCFPDKSSARIGMRSESGKSSRIMPLFPVMSMRRSSVPRTLDWLLVSLPGRSRMSELVLRDIRRVSGRASRLATTHSRSMSVIESPENPQGVERTFTSPDELKSPAHHNVPQVEIAESSFSRFRSLETTSPGKERLPMQYLLQSGRSQIRPFHPSSCQAKRAVM